MFPRQGNFSTVSSFVQTVLENYDFSSSSIVFARSPNESWFIGTKQSPAQQEGD
jgi:hypothetical protein